MEELLNKVLYYETFKNNQLMNLYIYDLTKPTKYRVETVKNYDLINKILQVIDGEMLKIGRVEEVNHKTKINYFPHQGYKVEFNFNNINYEKAVGIMERQEKIEKQKLQEAKEKLGKKASRNKKIAFLSAAIAGLSIFYAMNVTKKYKNVDVKPYPISIETVAPTLIPTTVPTVVPTIVPTIAPTVVPTTIPTVIPTIAPTVVPTTVPTVVPTIAPTIAPTIVPTPKSLESERVLVNETVKPTTNISLSEKEDLLAKKLNEATIKISNSTMIGTQHINKEIFTDPIAASSAVKILNGDFNFNETTIDETDSYKGILLMSQAAASFVFTGDQDIAQSNYITDEYKKAEVKNIENELLMFRNGVNNEDKLIEMGREIMNNTSYETKEIDYINITYIATASQNFRTRKDVFEEFSIYSGQLMIEINEYCHQNNFNK